MERVFGVTVCAIHNFIQIHNPDEGPIPNDDPEGGYGEGNDQNPEPVEEEGTEEEHAMHDQIADHMW